MAMAQNAGTGTPVPKEEILTWKKISFTGADATWGKIDWVMTLDHKWQTYQACSSVRRAGGCRSGAFIVKGPGEVFMGSRSVTVVVGSDSLTHLDNYVITGIERLP